MAATKVQCGVTNQRINREPLDAESVMYSMEQLNKATQMKDKVHTVSGVVYAGMITSIINDKDESNNGPWYISYNISNNQVSYLKDRILTKSESYNAIESAISWGHLE
jgi:hypothetical protein